MRPETQTRQAPDNGKAPKTQDPPPLLSGLSGSTNDRHGKRVKRPSAGTFMEKPDNGPDNGPDNTQLDPKGEMIMEHPTNPGQEESVSEERSPLRRKFYHRTTSDAARPILAEGFRDWPDDELEIEGVWLSDRPVDCNEGAKGDTLLAVSLQIDDEAADSYEVVEDEKPYREWCFPSALINALGTVQVVNENDV